LALQSHHERVAPQPSYPELVTPFQRQLAPTPTELPQQTVLGLALLQRTPLEQVQAE
jgi:hypothetical protein